MHGFQEAQCHWAHRRDALHNWLLFIGVLPYDGLRRLALRFSRYTNATSRSRAIGTPTAMPMIAPMGKFAFGACGGAEGEGEGEGEGDVDVAIFKPSTRGSYSADPEKRGKRKA